MSDADPDRIRLRPGDRIEGLMKWLRNRGYLGSYVPAAERTFAHDVVLFGRPGEAARIAEAGATFVWDGQTVTIEPTP